jgi:hypothetical protein
MENGFAYEITMIMCFSSVALISPLAINQTCAEGATISL